MCPGCGNGVESWLHILRDCAYAREVWKELPTTEEFFRGQGPQWLKSRATTSATTSPDATTFLTAIWAIWKARNSLIFNKQRPPARYTARLAVIRAEEFKSARRMKFFHPVKSASQPTSWTPPSHGKLDQLSIRNYGGSGKVFSSRSDQDSIASKSNRIPPR